MELTIKKFNPTEAELTTLANKFKDLTIDGIEDKAGYKIVDEARKELQRTRGSIKRTGKAMRDDANKFAKSVIAYEKDLVGIIEPIEQDLAAKQKEIDETIIKLERQELLPERKRNLLAIDVEIDDDTILLMDEKEFAEFYTWKNELYLQKKADELKAKEEKLKQAEKIVELQKQAEIDKKEAVENERRRIEQEQKAEKEKEAEEMRAAAKNKTYQKWLKDNKYNEDDFIIKRNGNTFTLYKLLDEITIE